MFGGPERVRSVGQAPGLPAPAFRELRGDPRSRVAARPSAKPTRSALERGAAARTMQALRPGVRRGQSVE